MADYPSIFAIPAGDPRWRVYLHCVKDAPGVVGANTFLSVFNPVSSGKIHIALNSIVTTYAAAVTTVTQSMRISRITAASGGTLIAASAVNRFVSAHGNPSCEVRINNPTVTALANPLTVYPPVISTGVGSAGQTVPAPPGASFVIAPGEGVAFSTDAGDVDQIWNVTYAWAEFGIDTVVG